MADPRLVLMAVVFAILLPGCMSWTTQRWQEFSEEESNIAEGVTVRLFQKKTAGSVVQPPINRQICMEKIQNPTGVGAMAKGAFRASPL